MARTLEEKRPMKANLLGSIGTSNRCAVGGSVHLVVVVGDLLRRHRSMKEKGKRRTGKSGEWRVLYRPGLGQVNFLTRLDPGSDL
jgi:hypothetical protein